MKPADLFGVVVRATGLVACFYGLYWLLPLFMTRDKDAAPLPDLMVVIIGYMTVGVILFMYADFFVAISYRPKEDEILEENDREDEATESD